MRLEILAAAAAAYAAAAACALAAEAADKWPQTFFQKNIMISLYKFFLPVFLCKLIKISSKYFVSICIRKVKEKILYKVFQ